MRAGYRKRGRPSSPPGLTQRHETICQRRPLWLQFECPPSVESLRKEAACYPPKGWETSLVKRSRRAEAEEDGRERMSVAVERIEESRGVAIS
jgi:hypothetical protein